MPRKSDKSKRKEGYGEGDRENYKPYILQNEFSNTGTTQRTMCTLFDRMLVFLSNGEANLGLFVQFSDLVYDLKEQFPLDINQTLKIAADHSIRHPHDENGIDCVMTTDLLVTFKIGDQKFRIAYSVKPSSKFTKRTVEKWQLEKTYWSNLSVKFFIVTEHQLNVIVLKNLSVLREYFHKDAVYADPLLNFVKECKEKQSSMSVSDVSDKFSRIQSVTKAISKETMLFLFARKKLRFDLTKEFSWSMSLDTISFSPN